MATLPPNAELLAPRDRLNYFDAQSRALPQDMTALQAWNALMARPLPLMGLAFKIRDKISSLFGVKQIGGFTGDRKDTVQTGEHLDFFLVEDARPDRLLLTERDRHLDVLTCVAVHNRRLWIVSSVVTHNLFGRAYMLPVAVAHRIIVRAMLNRMPAPDKFVT